MRRILLQFILKFIQNVLKKIYINDKIKVSTSSTGTKGGNGMMVIVPQHIRDMCTRLVRSLERNGYTETLERVKALEKELESKRWILSDTNQIVNLTAKLLDFSRILPMREFEKVYVEQNVRPEVYFALNRARCTKLVQSEVSGFVQLWLQQLQPNTADCLIRQIELVTSDMKWRRLKKQGLDEDVKSKELFSQIKVGYIYTRKNTEFPKPLIRKEWNEMGNLTAEEELAFRYVFRIGTTERTFASIPLM